MTQHEAGSVKIMSSAQEVVRRGDLVAALSAANRELDAGREAGKERLSC